MADMKKPNAPRKPAVKRPNSKPVPMPVAPKKPSRNGATPVPMPKKNLRGPAAIKEIQRQVSPSGVKKVESGAKKAIDKKYPGLYKKSK
jgi:hypothetical protein